MKLNYKLLSAIIVALPVFSAAQEGTTNVDPPAIEDVGANTNIHVTPPTNTWYGTRGLSQTASAEALGEGRVIVGLNGSFYRQDREFAGSPNENAKFFTGIGSLAFGLSSYADLFASITGYGSVDYDNDHASGPGTVGAGLQLTLPFAPSAPVRMAAQAGLYQGLADHALDSNLPGGYSYFETRTGLDFMAKLIQSLVLGSEATGFKMHFNEGVVTSAESGADPLLLLSVGAQVNIFAAVLGAELHTRSNVNEIDFETDPLWATASLQIRSAYSINLNVGGDIALSQDRNDVANTRALEPYRLFAGIAFTIDTQASKRAEAKAKAQREAAEKAGLRNSNMSLQEKARQDSLENMRQKAQADSVANALAAKNREDSAAAAAKARQDSIALAESQKNLEIEKSKRSDAEKQLLSTGLLLMDAVYFETGKTDISINSKPYLNIIAKMLSKYPKLRIEVAGHTDNVGSDASNQALSQGRSESVMNYMVSVAPDLKEVLSAKGYGESMPKADNKSAAGRKLNRRTELQVTNKEALKEYNP